MAAAEQRGDQARDDVELVGAESVSGELVANDGQPGESIGHVIARAVALGVVAGGRALMIHPARQISSAAATALPAPTGEVLDLVR